MGQSYREILLGPLGRPCSKVDTTHLFLVSPALVTLLTIELPLLGFCLLHEAKGLVFRSRQFID
jgi:hypothetical protein